ncbi:MAG: universal stress protein [Gemmatimonadetes bacterium]|nr:universal stress protein [Gemmatimonadota bacterium]
MTGLPRGAAESARREGLDGLRFLVCVGGGPESAETLDFATRVLKAVGGDLTILYVAPKVPQSIRDEVAMSHRKLAEWDAHLPGVAFLRFARDRFAEAGLLKLDEREKPIVRDAPQTEFGGAFELGHLGTYGESVLFRIREGEIAEEIRRETRCAAYDLLIIGAGTNRRLQHKLAQFGETSILFVKNVRPGPYRFLVCTGGEQAGTALAEFTARAARALHLGVTVLSVDDLRQSRESAERWVRQLAAVFTAGGVETRTLVLRGSLVKTIVEAAGEDHVIVIGRSNVPEIKKFFFGSRPIRVIQEARCPVLHVI